MIESFRSKALKRYWVKGNDTGIRPDWRIKVRLILTRLDAARTAEEMDVPGFGFHALKGNLLGRFAVSVSRNWRITFGWRADSAIEVDMEDYHGD